MVKLESGTYSIACEGDIVGARHLIRELATKIGFSITDLTRIVTSVSELARNIYRYAQTGEMHWQVGTDTRGDYIELLFEDHGPGIPNIEQAMTAGFTTGKGLGLGLSGVKRLMDDLCIESTVAMGTRVKAKKWLKA